MNSISQAHFDNARLRFYDKVGVCKFTKKQRLCLQFIRKRSWDIGLTRAWIPALRYFTDDTGLYKPDVCDGLNELERMKVIQEDPRFLYGINVLFDNWFVEELRPRGQVLMGLDGGPPEDLNEVMRLSFVELGKKILPTRVTGVPPDVSPGRMEPGQDVSLVSRGGMAACPEPGSSARRAAEEQKPPPHPGSANEDVPVCIGAQGVSEKLTVEAGVSPASVSNLLTAPIPKPENEPGSAVVSNLLTAAGQGATVSPRSPLVQKEQPVQVLNELQRIEDFVQPARARGVSKKLTRITWAEQRAMEDLVRSWVGPEDMARSRTLWVDKAIRNFPDAVSFSVHKLKQLEERNPGYFKGATAQERQLHKIKILVRDLAKEAGVSSWGQVRPGPEPV